MSMTRKHFEEIAAILAGDLATSTSPAEIRKVMGITYSLADFCYRQNPRFDRDRFYTAVGIT